MKNRSLRMVFAMLICLLFSFPAAAFDAAPASDTGYIVQLTEPLPSLLSLSEQKALLEEIYSPLGLYTVQDPAYVEMLQAEGLIVYAEPDYEVELFTTETTVSMEDTSLDLWHLDMLGTSHADELGCFGQGVCVAVIDSGVQSHPDLTGNLLPGYNYITDTTDVTDNIGHGTFVAGLIAAEDNGMGVTGVAPAAKVLPLKCFDTNVTTRVSMICRAIYAAVDEYDCQILNMSFGVKKHSETFETAIQYAADQGIILVSSAGNLGTSELYYPAAFDSVIGVGAVDAQSVAASFSQRNESVMVVAPGKAVYSTNNSGDYSAKNGTSFAAPLVSASVARLLNIKDTLTPHTAMQSLTANAVDLGDEGYDTTYGFGLVSLPAACTYLLGDTPLFLSPIHSSAHSIQFTVLNNQSEQFLGQCFFTEYKNDFMQDLFWQDLKLEPTGTVTITYPLTENTVKIFLWRNHSDISVITPYRECEGSSCK